MIRISGPVTPSAPTLAWGLGLMLGGTVIAQLGTLNAVTSGGRTGWLIFGGLTALVGFIALAVGQYQLATNVDIAAQGVVRILAQVQPQLARALATETVPPPGPDDDRPIAPMPLPADVAQAVQALPTEGIAVQMARLRELQEAGTLTPEQFAAEKARALRAWSGQ